MDGAWHSGHGEKASASWLEERGFGSSNVEPRLPPAAGETEGGDERADVARDAYILRGVRHSKNPSSFSVVRHPLSSEVHLTEAFCCTKDGAIQVSLDKERQPSYESCHTPYKPKWGITPMDLAIEKVTCVLLQTRVAVGQGIKPYFSLACILIRIIGFCRRVLPYVYIVLWKNKTLFFFFYGLYLFQDLISIIIIMASRISVNDTKFTFLCENLLDFFCGFLSGFFFFCF